MGCSRAAGVSTPLNFQSLFESAPALFLVLRPDSDYTILAASDQYLGATLTQRDKIVGRPLFDVFPDDPEDAEATGPINLRTSLDQVVATKRVSPMGIQKYSIARPESEGGGFEERYWSPINAPVLNEAGELIYIIHRVKDVTALKRASSEQEQQRISLERYVETMQLEILLRSEELADANRRLQQMNIELERHGAELEAANNEIESFSYSVSHDLRAPLRAIDGFGQALLEDYADRLDQTGRDYLMRVRAATARMSDLIDDLLRLSRISRAEIGHERVDLSALATAVIDELRRDEPERSVAISIQPGMEVAADPALVRVLLVNLISNAWKFTRPKPTARIAFAQENEGERPYYISDNGVGFDMAYADKLFGAFQRLHDGSEFQGTGIGLTLAQRVVHRHRGRIWADAKVDRGATFYFTIPHRS